MSMLDDREVVNDEVSPGQDLSGVKTVPIHPRIDGHRRIRVLLADDSHRLRNTLAQILRLEPDLEVVAEAADGLEAIAMAKTAEPDVVLMDCSMPRLDGIQATRRIAAELPHIRVVGFSLHGKEFIGAKMLQAGAIAYVAKGDSLDELIQAIREAFILRSAKG